MAPRSPRSAQPDKPDEPVVAVDEPEVKVRARWVSPQACRVPGIGIVRYGDELMVSVGQLDHPDQPTVPWDDGWVPDPVLADMADQEG